MRKTAICAIIALVTIAGLSTIDTISSDPEVSLEKKWETDRVLKVPESVLYDRARNIIYVANINGTPADKDGNGFISKLSVDGKIENLQWVTGLDAPKGMGVYKNRLYVTDISSIVEIDIDRGKILKRYDIGGKFLNDITVDTTGRVYVSDMAADRIYRLAGGRVTTWMSSEGLQNPNGLFIEKNRLMVASKGGGNIKIIDIRKKSIKDWTSIGGNPDGLVSDGRGNYLLSSWNGEVYFIKSSGEKVRLFDTRASNINSADIDYIPSERILLVPTFFDNRVVAYELKY
jgi:sugar lactone lactonase YvrE